MWGLLPGRDPNQRIKLHRGAHCIFRGEIDWADWGFPKVKTTVGVRHTPDKNHIELNLTKETKTETETMTVCLTSKDLSLKTSLDPKKRRAPAEFCQHRERTESAEENGERMEGVVLRDSDSMFETEDGRMKGKGLNTWQKLRLKKDKASNLFSSFLVGLKRKKFGGMIHLLAPLLTLGLEMAFPQLETAIITGAIVLATSGFIRSEYQRYREWTKKGSRTRSQKRIYILDLVKTGLPIAVSEAFSASLGIDGDFLEFFTDLGMLGVEGLWHLTAKKKRKEKEADACATSEEIATTATATTATTEVAGASATSEKASAATFQPKAGRTYSCARAIPIVCSTGGSKFSTSLLKGDEVEVVEVLPFEVRVNAAKCGKEAGVMRWLDTDSDGLHIVLEALQEGETTEVAEREEVEQEVQNEQQKRQAVQQGKQAKQQGKQAKQLATEVAEPEETTPAPATKWSPTVNQMYQTTVEWLDIVMATGYVAPHRDHFSKSPKAENKGALQRGTSVMVHKLYKSSGHAMVIFNPSGTKAFTEAKRGDIQYLGTDGKRALEGIVNEEAATPPGEWKPTEKMAYKCTEKRTITYDDGTEDQLVKGTPVMISALVVGSDEAKVIVLNYGVIDYLDSSQEPTLE
eukprot:gnl/TRDRNA2_/TRDRNA2_175374_c4_seq1.p1 gnl/TRDRNA2_/TRDRNA2_175374_c4~~gnl/TRDRNA2_/TRDRNA2_175374_c4_seq1.p1  ORF type:complete len:735 (-),score=98.42 gnl/TRDRNA2_/TRDRNA2_175374_c4_seq1:231-2126(-)